MSSPEQDSEESPLQRSSPGSEEDAAASAESDEEEEDKAGDSDDDAAPSPPRKKRGGAAPEAARGRGAGRRGGGRAGRGGRAGGARKEGAALSLAERVRASQSVSVAGVGARTDSLTQGGASRARASGGSSSASLTQGGTHQPASGSAVRVGAPFKVRHALDALRALLSLLCTFKPRALRVRAQMPVPNYRPPEHRPPATLGMRKAYHGGVSGLLSSLTHFVHNPLPTQGAADASAAAEQVRALQTHESRQSALIRPCSTTCNQPGVCACMQAAPLLIYDPSQDPDEARRTTLKPVYVEAALAAKLRPHQVQGHEGPHAGQPRSRCPCLRPCGNVAATCTVRVCGRCAQRDGVKFMVECLAGLRKGGFTGAILMDGARTCGHTHTHAGASGLAHAADWSPCPRQASSGARAGTARAAVARSQAWAWARPSSPSARCGRCAPRVGGVRRPSARGRRQAHCRRAGSALTGRACMRAAARARLSRRGGQAHVRPAAHPVPVVAGYELGQRAQALAGRRQGGPRGE